MKRLLMSVCALITAAGAAHAADCQATPEVRDKTTLTEISDTWFGDPSFRFAILLATNARSTDPRFGFIGNPNRLVRYAPDGTRHGPRNVCVPALEEAVRLRNRYDRYLQAVQDMAFAEPSEIVSTLDPAPQSGPVRLVSWVRADQAQGMPAAGEPLTTGGATWVTLDPHIRDFCKGFVANHSANADAVTLRLEQRLGLPPNASKTHFVTFELPNASPETLFRPCADPEVSDNTCTLGPPASCAEGEALCHARNDFFYKQYYSSYGVARPVEYPWTSLGYTFDWAPAPAGPDGTVGFVSVGESEYVVPDGVKLTVVSIEPTMTYCSP